MADRWILIRTWLWRVVQLVIAVNRRVPIHEVKYDYFFLERDHEQIPKGRKS
jgi:hypothetical protein